MSCEADEGARTAAPRQRLSLRVPHRLGLKPSRTSRCRRIPGSRIVWLTKHARSTRAQARRWRSNSRPSPAQRRRKTSAILLVAVHVRLISLTSSATRLRPSLARSGSRQSSGGLLFIVLISHEGWGGIRFLSASSLESSRHEQFKQGMLEGFARAKGFVHRLLIGSISPSD